MHPLKMYFLFNMGIFHCYVSLPEGTFFVGEIFEILMVPLLPGEGDAY